MLSTKVFDHSPEARSGKYGENLYYAWGSPSLSYTIGQASQGWYNEIKDYNFATFKSINGNAVGHFTAMIWKSAKKVGFGFAIGPKDKGYAIYITANYSPVTNVIGQYGANVPKPL